MLGMAACAQDTKTETITVTNEVFPACDATHPTGQCDAGQICFEAECVDSATLCSPTNLTGACTAGTICFAGGCVLETALCSPTAPTGPCELGSVCVEGMCVATASLCSSSNPTGTCAGDLTCIDGICGTPEVDPCSVHVYTTQPTVVAKTATSQKAVITVDGLQFKDLSGDGALDPYEDWRLLEICRAKDLVSKMSIPEKVGTMSEGSRVGSGTEDGTIPDNVTAAIVEKFERYALIRTGSRTPQQLAVYLNNVQELAETQPWGIPVTITADPIHGFGLSTNNNTGEQSVNPSSVVSPWPYPL
ncbi:MAG: hypothetical protein CVV17_01520, partial [Gammaproteobacteria bacterium HGW-Gammaproteobacteria-7]